VHESCCATPAVTLKNILCETVLVVLWGGRQGQIKAFALAEYMRAFFASHVSGARPLVLGEHPSGRRRRTRLPSSMRQKSKPEH